MLETQDAAAGDARARDNAATPWILIVEDDDLVRRALVTRLARAGRVAISASCAEDALTLLAHAPVGLLLTDYVLPGAMSGAALARQVQVRWPHLQVIIMTGHDISQTDRPDFPLLRKPFANEELMDAIAHLKVAA